jgi:hypothetical protein
MLPIFPNFPETSSAYSFLLATRFNSTSHWDSLYHRPTTGLALAFHDFGNDEILGHGVTLQYYFRFNKEINEKWEWSPAIFMGASWFDRPYHYLDHRDNLTVGNAFSFFMSVDTRIEYSLNSNWKMYSGFTFLHSSNSHTALPNYGINIPQVYLGAAYQFNKNKSVNDSRDALAGLRNDWQFGARFGLGHYELGGSGTPTNGPTYFVYGLSLLARKNSGNIGYWTFSLEGSFNRGTETYLELLEEDPQVIDASALIAYAGHEFMYGRFGLLTQVGFNIYNPGLKKWIETTTDEAPMDQIKKFVPGRFGANFYLNQPYHSPKWNAFIGLHIKSKLFQADYLDTVVGFTF